MGDPGKLPYVLDADVVMLTGATQFSCGTLQRMQNARSHVRIQHCMPACTFFVCHHAHICHAIVAYGAAKPGSPCKGD